MRISICTYLDNYSIKKNEIAPSNLFPDLNLEEEIDLDLNLQELIECMENTTYNESVKLKRQKKCTKHTTETKHKVADCIRKGFTQKAVAEHFGISYDLVKEWKTYGSRTKTNKTYSIIFKKKVALQRHIGRPLKDLVQEFDVCRSTISKWARDPSLQAKIKKLRNRQIIFF